ncbi:MAG: hypothetical protein ABWY56_17280 [Propionibacteriaceae bacterium]
MSPAEESQPAWDSAVLHRLRSVPAPTAVADTPVEDAVPAATGATVARRASPDTRPTPDPSPRAPSGAASGSDPDPSAGDATAAGAETHGSVWDSPQARQLGARYATRSWRRALTTFTGISRSDTTPDRWTETVTQCQTAISTGRRVAVVAAHGGAGASTLTVVVGLLLANLRRDSVAVLAGRPDRQVLQHRLGCREAASAVEVRDLLAAHPGNPTAVSLVNLRVPDTTCLRAVTDSDDPDVVAEVADQLSRRHAVTLIDAGPTTRHPVLASAHGVLVVGRLSIEGVAQVGDVLTELSDRMPLSRLQVVLVDTGVDSGLTERTARRLLEPWAVPVSVLPADRHVASGARISLSLLSDRSKVAVAEIAALALGLATGRA